MARSAGSAITTLLTPGGSNLGVWIGAQVPENTNAANSESLRRIYLAVTRPIVPRAPSLELYVLPSGGGQLINFQKLAKYSGAEGDRTPDLCSAIAALSQLSYSPAMNATDCPRTSRADPSHRIKAKAPRNNAGPLLLKVADPRLKSRPKRCLRPVTLCPASGYRVGIRG